MALRDTLRSLTPQFLLDLFRGYKRKKTRSTIQDQLNSGEVLSQEDLGNQIKSLGVSEGNHVLVHCALSKLGAVDGGPQTLIDAFKKVIGENGNILMPSSPNASFQLEYIQNINIFDVDNEPSKMGAVSETFRENENVLRSAHPTEPVCVWGKDALWYTAGHETDGTAYGKNSPFYKLTEKKGKVLYIGVTLDNAGTSLHVLEDAVENFKYPVYAEEIFTVQIKNGEELKTIQTKVHNPEQSKKRRCDELLPMFIEKDVAKKLQLGVAETWVFDAEKMLNVMLEEYNNNGVTMYTPFG